MKLIDKAAVVAEIERRKHKLLDTIICERDKEWVVRTARQLNRIIMFLDTLEVVNPYEQWIQYASIEAGIKAHAEEYSFNIESELFNQLTKEQQALWRKEIEEAVISGGYNGLTLAKDPRYEENHEVKKLQEEPVSEYLEEVISYLSKRYPEVSFAKLSRIAVYVAKWQKQQDQSTIELAEDHAMLAGMEKMKEQMTKGIWKPADGDDLPEIDREVIALVAYDFGHYKVVYAHRPNPNGWNGTNIVTGEEEHFEPEIYGKGGWNQPHVLYWLDARLPYEENKIDK